MIITCKYCNNAILETDGPCPICGNEPTDIVAIKSRTPEGKPSVCD